MNSPSMKPEFEAALAFLFSLIVDNIGVQL